MIGLLFFFSALGAFNGILLSLYLFFFSKQRTLSKLLLGALILALSIRIGKSVLLYFDRDLPKIYLQIGLSACLFIGPLLYFYLKTVINEISEFPKRWKWIVGILLALIIIVGALRPYPIYPDFWNTYVVHTIYAIWLLFVVAAGVALKPVFQKGLNLLPSDKWLLSIYIGNVLIATLFFLAIFGFSSAYYISGPITFSFFLYLLTFGYFNGGWFEIATKKPLEKYANKKIASPEANKLIEQLDLLMIKDGIHKNPSLKLKEVATQLEIPSHRLSQLLNDNLGKSYATFINEYRINSACQLLGTNHQLSLEGIGYEVGFRSKSTFFTTFKKIKGLTPAQYQQQILSK